MLLGFTEYSFLGLFSSEETGREAGAVVFEEVEQEHIQKDGSVYALNVTIETFFDQDINYVFTSISVEDNFKKIPIITSEGNLLKICKAYVERLADFEKDIILNNDGNIEIGEIISSIIIDNMRLEPDECLDDF